MEAETHEEYVPSDLTYFVMGLLFVDEDAARKVLREDGIIYLSLFDKEDCYQAYSKRLRASVGHGLPTPMRQTTNH